MIRSKIDMIQATRLTRQGRLAEAMAILRGTGLGDFDSGKASNNIPHEVEPRMPTFLDMEWHSRQSNQSRTARLISEIRSGNVLLQPTGLLKHLLELKHSGPVDGLFRRGIKPVQPALPDGAKFYDRSFSNNAGTRSYKLYVPSGYRGQPIPLVVMLHGCTQSPEDFSAGTRMNELAEEQMLLVAYPAQAQSANASKCWNWFSSSDQSRDHGEPSLIAGITREIMRHFSVKAGQVYIAGLSAGGAAAAVMGATYPDLYAAVGVHSGLACGAASDIPSAFTAMREGAQSLRSTRGIPTIVFHGDADSTVNPRNGDQIIMQGKANRALTATCNNGEEGGVRYRRKVYRDQAGRTILEHWVLQNIGHAWSGGSPAGSYTEPRGPDASREMVRFFLEHSVCVR